MDDRRALHLLVDELPEKELPAAKRFMEQLGRAPRDSLRMFLDSVAVDDEPVTEEDLEAIQEGLSERARGEVIPHEEVKRLVGGTE